VATLAQKVVELAQKAVVAWEVVIQTSNQAHHVKTHHSAVAIQLNQVEEAVVNQISQATQQAVDNQLAFLRGCYRLRVVAVEATQPDFLRGQFLAVEEVTQAVEVVVHCLHLMCLPCRGKTSRKCRGTTLANTRSSCSNRTIQAVNKRLSLLIWVMAWVAVFKA